MTVVFEDASEDYYPSYQTVKMIDFGLAFEGENAFAVRRRRIQ